MTGPARVIGLTGGVASGKSTVAAMLRARGAVVVDADELAHRVVETGEPALEEIVAAFGPAMRRDDGTLDRPRLATAVFRDPAARLRLEAITHPRIRVLSDRAVAEARRAGAPLVVCDIPLLFEAHREGDVDGVVVVYAPPAVQLRRLRARDHLDPDEADRRLAAQWPIADKRARATWVIDNGGDRASTRRQVGRWWEEVVGTG